MWDVKVENSEGGTQKYINYNVKKLFFYFFGFELATMLLNYPSNYLCILKKCTWRDLYQTLCWLLGTNDKLFLNLQFPSFPVSILLN